MKKITVMGLLVKKDESFGQTDGGTSYGNLLHYPGILARRMLEAEGFQIYSEEELPPEQADIVFCRDLSKELWERIQALPARVHKVLQACGSPIYACFSHHAQEVVMNPIWDKIMTWNRSFEADHIVYYDIPVAGKSVSEPLEPMPDITSDFLAGRGVVTAALKNDNRGVTPFRDALYYKLACMGIIDVYGKNWKADLKHHIFGASDNKLKCFHGYPFALAIENIWASGYVTEKLPDCILAGVPAIYWGDFHSAQRRFPNTFIPLEEISVPGVMKARKLLIDRYAQLRENVLKCREESDHWCDSYLNAIKKIFSIF